MIVSVERKEAMANSVEKGWKTFKKYSRLKMAEKNPEKTTVMFCLGSSSNPFSATCSPAAVSENLTFLLKSNFLSDFFIMSPSKVGVHLLTFIV